jgi:uncharacterized OB-fold protein
MLPLQHLMMAASHPRAPGPETFDGPPARPAVGRDEHVVPFYDGAAQGKLLLAYCPACDRHDLPGTRVCPRCLSLEMIWREASGDGSVFSFVVFQRSLHPAFKVPYAVCVIELDEGPRMVGSVSGLEPHEITTGMRVEASFLKVPENGIPVDFKPAGEAPPKIDRG